MNSSIKSKMIAIGNSRGIRIPRTIIEQIGLTENVELMVEGNKLIVQSASTSRTGWQEQFSEMTKKHEDILLDEITPTQWDEEEWTW
ncbi:MAG: AbrB/MazE/SpoVT family DNA-binding domain-containing protein [Anaerolinea sp.]|nr:AbrB/MazE/SpoVT family DNA-binding domain-containing protein [Anaerolinea sp.]